MAAKIIKTIDVVAIDPWPRGITTDRKYLWMTGAKIPKVHQIDKSGNLISSFGTVDEPYGITTDGKYLWVVEFIVDVTGIINQYDKSGNLIQTIVVSAIDIYPRGVTTDGKYLWWVGGQNNKVYQIDKSGNLISSFSIGIGSTGITTDGKYLWILRRISPVASYIARFDKSGNLIQTIVVSAIDTYPRGITTDRKYLWWTGSQYAKIYQMSKD